MLYRHKLQVILFVHFVLYWLNKDLIKCCFSPPTEFHNKNPDEEESEKPVTTNTECPDTPHVNKSLSQVDPDSLPSSDDPNNSFNALTPSTSSSKAGQIVLNSDTVNPQSI